MNAVGTAYLGRVFEFKRAALEHGRQRIDFLQQQIAGVAQQERISSINHVG